MSTVERWSLSPQPLGCPTAAPQALNKGHVDANVACAWQTRIRGGCLGKHREFMGLQTHRLWADAVADLLTTLHSALLVNPLDSGTGASPHPLPVCPAALRPSFSPSLTCSTQAVGLPTSVTNGASKVPCQALFQQKRSWLQAQRPQEEAEQRTYYFIKPPYSVCCGPASKLSLLLHQGSPPSAL